MGYGGTASEMARLVNESGVLGKDIEITAKTINSVSFDKIIEAINVTQQRLGVTGTTAKEAAATIQGSMSSVKASWQNVVTAIGNANGDIEGAVSRLADTVAAFAGNMLPVIQTAITGIGKLVSSLAPKIVKAIPKLFKETVPGLVKTIGSLVPIVLEALQEAISTLAEQVPVLLPVLLDAWQKLFLGLITAFNNVVQILIPMMPQIIDTIGSTLQQGLPQLIQGGFMLLMGLIDGFVENLDQIIDMAVGLIILIADSLIANMDKIINAGFLIISGLIKGLSDHLPELLQKAVELVAAIAVEIVKPENLKKLGNAALDLIGALGAGLVQTFAPISDALSDIFVKISEWFKEKWEFIKGYGRYLIDGIKEGIKDAVNGWADFWEDVGGDMIMDIADFFGIASPSKLMRDFVGKNLALGISEGFTDEMAHVNDTIQNSLPRSFDTDVNVNTNSAAGGTATAGARVITLRLADGWGRIIAEGTVSDINLLQSDLVTLGEMGVVT